MLESFNNREWGRWSEKPDGIKVEIFSWKLSCTQLVEDDVVGVVVVELEVLSGFVAGVNFKRAAALEDDSNNASFVAKDSFKTSLK